MGKIKGQISAEEWSKGKSNEGDLEKAKAIMGALEQIGRNGASCEKVKALTGIKWPYSTLKALVKSNKLEQKKIGKALYYRMKVKGK